MKNTYVGHPSQLCDVEQVQLIGGKGNGMRLLKVRNAEFFAFCACTKSVEEEPYKMLFTF